MRYRAIVKELSLRK